MGITAKIENITPDLARQYLEKNTNNYRNLSKQKVQSYAEDMKAGNWQINGEGIAFSENGMLKDGQHRLHAIISSGVTIPMLVIRGVADDVQIYDWGMGRTNSQIIKARGINIGTDNIGAARIIISGFHKSASKGAVDEYVMAHHQELHEAGLIARRGGGARSIGKKATCCLAVYVAKRLDLIRDNILEEFFFIFNNGTTLPEQLRDPSPALVASRTFITKYVNVSGNGQVDQYSTIMQAMLDYKANKGRRIEYKTNVERPFQLLNQLRLLDGLAEVK